MSNTIGQCVLLDNAVAGLISDASSLSNVVIAVPTALVGSLTLLDGDGNTVLTVNAGQSGAFPIAGIVNRLEYRLSNAADLGVVMAAFRPV